jgi:hypothetical protein
MLNAAWVLEKAVPPLLKAAGSDYVLKKFTLAHQQFDLDGAYQLSGIALDLADRQAVTRLSLARLGFSSLYPFIKQTQARTIDLTLSDLDVSRDRLRIQDASATAAIDLADTHNIEIRGTVTIDSVLNDGILITELSTPFECTPGGLRLSDIRGQLYDGSIIGHAFFQTAENGSFQTIINGAGIDLVKLAHDKPELFGRVEGLANFSAHVEGRGDELSLLKVECRIVKDAKVNAAMLGPLMSYLPQQSTQRRDLEALIRTGSMIPLDTSVVHLRSISVETVTADIELKSTQFNLDINLTVDLNIEGGILKSFGLLDNVKNTPTR